MGVQEEAQWIDKFSVCAGLSGCCIFCGYVINTYMDSQITFSYWALAVIVQQIIISSKQDFLDLNFFHSAAKFSE